MNETLKNRLKSQRGFSITELMIAAGVAIFVAVGVGMVIVQQQDVDNTTLLQSNLDTAHSLKIQKVRSVDGLKTALNITAANLPCFGKRDSASSCAGLNKASATALPAFGGETNTNLCIDPPNCFVVSNVTYTLACTAERCESLQLQISTAPSADAIARGRVAKERRTTVVIPGFMFSNKTAIDFSCGSSIASVPLSIDYKRLVLDCGPASIATPVPCTNTPLINFTNSTRNCYSGASDTCATGMREFGILPGQATCA